MIAHNGGASRGPPFKCLARQKALFEATNSSISEHLGSGNGLRKGTKCGASNLHGAVECHRTLWEIIQGGSHICGVYLGRRHERSHHACHWQMCPEKGSSDKGLPDGTPMRLTFHNHGACSQDSLISCQCVQSKTLNIVPTYHRPIEYISCRIMSCVVQTSLTQLPCQAAAGCPMASLMRTCCRGSRHSICGHGHRHSCQERRRQSQPHSASACGRSCCGHHHDACTESCLLEIMQ